MDPQGEAFEHEEESFVGWREEEKRRHLKLLDGALKIFECSPNWDILVAQSSELAEDTASIEALQQTGVMSWNVAQRLLHQINVTHEDERTILGAMRILGAIAQTSGSEHGPLPETGCSFYVPCMVAEHHGGQFAWRQVIPSDHQPTPLIFRPQNCDVWPEVVFHRLVALCCGVWNATSPPQLWRDCATFHVKEQNVLLELSLYQQRYIVGTVFIADDGNEHSLVSLGSVCSDVCHVLIGQLVTAKMRGFHGLKFNVCVKHVEMHGECVMDVSEKKLVVVDDYELGQAAVSDLEERTVSVSSCPGLKLWYEKDDPGSLLPLFSGSERSIYRQAVREGYVNLDMCVVHVVGDGVGKETMIETLRKYFHSQKYRPSYAAERILYRNLVYHRHGDDVVGLTGLYMYVVLNMQLNSDFLDVNRSTAQLSPPRERMKSSMLPAAPSQSDSPSSSSNNFGVTTELMEPVPGRVNVSDYFEMYSRRFLEFSRYRDLSVHGDKFLSLRFINHGSKPFLPTFTLSSGRALFSAFIVVMDLSRRLTDPSESDSSQTYGDELRDMLYDVRKVLLRALDLHPVGVFVPPQPIIVIGIHDGGLTTSFIDEQRETFDQLVEGTGCAELMLHSLEGGRRQILFHIDINRLPASRRSRKMVDMGITEHMQKWFQHRTWKVPMTWVDYHNNCSSQVRFSVKSLTDFCRRLQRVGKLESENEAKTALKWLHNVHAVYHYHHIPGLEEKVFGYTQQWHDLLSVFMTRLDVSLPPELTADGSSVATRGEVSYQLARLLLDVAKDKMMSELLENLAVVFFHSFAIISQPVMAGYEPTNFVLKPGCLFFAPHMVTQTHRGPLLWQQVTPSNTQPPPLIFCLKDGKLWPHRLFANLVCRCIDRFHSELPELKRNRAVFCVSEKLRLEVSRCDSCYLTATVCPSVSDEIVDIKDLEEVCYDVRTFVSQQLIGGGIMEVSVFEIKFGMYFQPGSVSESIDFECLVCLDEYPQQSVLISNARRRVQTKECKGLHIWFNKRDQLEQDSLLTVLTPSEKALYHRALQHGKVDVARVKLHIVGRDGVGKTCFVDSLLDLEFQRDRDSTDGTAVSVMLRTSEGWQRVTAGAERDAPYVSKVLAKAYVEQKQGNVQMERELMQQPLTSVSEEMDIQEVEVQTSVTAETRPVEQTVASRLTADRLTPSSEAKRLPRIYRDLARILKMGEMDEKTIKLVQLLEQDKELLGDCSKIFIITTWDHGGQQVFLPGHSALMPDCSTYSLSMYMVVLNMSQPLADKAVSMYVKKIGDRQVRVLQQLVGMETNGDVVSYFLSALKMAHSSWDQSEGQKKIHIGQLENTLSPPVFMVATHCLDPKALAIAEQQEMSFQQLVEGKGYLSHIVVARVNDEGREEYLFRVDNSLSGTGNPDPMVVDIQRRIEAMTRSYWEELKEPIPLRWFHFEQVAIRLSNDLQYKVMDLSDLVIVGQKVCQLESGGEVMASLKLLTSVGAVLCYHKVAYLKDKVFTDPQWLATNLSTFVTVLEKELVPPKLKRLVEHLSSTGEMKWELAEYLLEKTGVKSNQYDTILKVLHLFDIICRAFEEDDNSDDAVPKPGCSFFVACMLKKEYKGQFAWRKASPSGRLPPSLIFRPKEVDSWPEHLFFRFLSRCAAQWKKPQPKLTRNVGNFSLGGNLRLEIANHDMHYVIATIYSLNDRRIPSAADLSKKASNIRQFLIDQLNEAKIRGVDGFQFTVCIQPLDDEGHVADSIDDKSLACIDDYDPEDPALVDQEQEGVDLDLCPGLDLWFSSEDNGKAEVGMPGRTPGKSTSYIARLAREMRHAASGRFWEDWTDIPIYVLLEVCRLAADKPYELANHLGVSELELRDRPRHDTPSDTVRHIMRAWVQGEGSSATLDLLLQALDKMRLLGELEGRIRHEMKKR